MTGHSKSRLAILGSIAFFIIGFTPVDAQTTASIRGTIRDEQGAVLPVVSVTITNEETGAVRELTTGADGSYHASQLIPGRYKVSAKLASFRTFERGGQVLPVGNGNFGVQYTHDATHESNSDTYSLTTSTDPAQGGSPTTLQGTF